MKSWDCVLHHSKVVWNQDRVFWCSVVNELTRNHGLKFWNRCLRLKGCKIVMFCTDCWASEGFIGRKRLQRWATFSNKCNSFRAYNIRNQTFLIMWTVSKHMSIKRLYIRYMIFWHVWMYVCMYAWMHEIRYVRMPQKFQNRVL